MSRVQRSFLVGCFVAYLVLVGVARTQDPTATADWIPAALTLYVFLVAAPLLFLRSSLSWFHPLVFSSLIRLIDLLRRFAMYAWGLDRHIALPSTPEELSELIVVHLLLHSAAVVAHYVGFLMGPRLPVPRLRFPSTRSLVPKLVVVCALALIAFVVYVGAQGGLERHIEDWAGGRHQSLAGEHYQLVIINLGIPACWIWLACRDSAARSLWFWAAAATALVVAFLATGSRSSVVYPAVVGLIIWMLRERRVVYLRLIFAALVAIYLVTILGNFRRSGWYGRPDWEAATEGSISETIASGVQGELTQRLTTTDGALPIYARVPDDVPLLYGSSYLAVLTLPIPRAVWPEKPGLIGGRVGRTFFGLNAGFPPGAVGEAYWNFHIPGVLVVFFLFGVFQKWLADAFVRYRDRAAAIPIYAASLFLFGEPSGASFVTAMFVLVPMVILLIALGALGVGGAPRASARPGTR